jgi:hypothetical protein
MTVTNALDYNSAVLIATINTFVVEAPGPNGIKLFTAVIYYHAMVIQSLCVIKQH